MIRPPPRSTRTDTLFPYTTLFRSLLRHRYAALLVVDQLCGAAGMQSLDCSRRARTVRAGSDEEGFGLDCDGEPAPEDANPRRGASSEPSECKRQPSNENAFRLEGARVGTEFVSQVQLRWSPY